MAAAPGNEHVEHALILRRQPSQGGVFALQLIQIAFVEIDRRIAHDRGGRVIDKGQPETARDCHTVDGHGIHRAGLTILNIGQRIECRRVAELGRDIRLVQQKAGGGLAKGSGEVTRETEGAVLLASRAAGPTRSVVAVAGRIRHRIRLIPQEVGGDVHAVGILRICGGFVRSWVCLCRILRLGSFVGGFFVRDLAILDRSRPRSEDRPAGLGENRDVPFEVHPAAGQPGLGRAVRQVDGNTDRDTGLGPFGPGPGQSHDR